MSPERPGLVGTSSADRPGLEKYDAPDGFTPFFVGGPPRTGTTALHALICTSPKFNGYIGECSYFGAFMQPLQMGLATFDIHTKHYFNTRDEFLTYHGSILANVLSEIWRKLERPEMLSLKSPLMTPHFHWLAKMLNDARFVVTARDPYDTISSRVEVLRRINGSDEIADDTVREVCLEYTDFYLAVLDNLDAFGDRLCLVNYERLVAGEELPKLEAFGVTGLRPDRIWLDAVTNVNEYSDNPWATPLYGQKLTKSSIGRHRHVLSSNAKNIIAEICGDVARRLGLPSEAPLREDASAPAGG